MESYDCSASMELEKQEAFKQEAYKQEAYATIARDVEDLKTSMEIMHELVTTQQDDLDSIEDFIIASKEEITMAEKHIVEAHAIENSYGYVGGLIGIIGMMGVVLAVLF